MKKKSIHQQVKEARRRGEKVHRLKLTEADKVELEIHARVIRAKHRAKLRAKARIAALKKDSK
jgi:hypothetical protein